MSLFLPLLLLGLAQTADQPAKPAAAQDSTQNTKAAFLNPLKFVSPTPGKNAGVLRGRQIVMPGTETDEGSLCFTMRTYLFERRNGFAPEPVGMTTCQPATARKQKRLTGEPKFVPAADKELSPKF